MWREDNGDIIRLGLLALVGLFWFVIFVKGT